jgi:hypothetical protein
MLVKAIRTLAQRAGIARPAFHVTCVSQDPGGIFIMQTMWPEGKRLCEALADAVDAFPTDHYTTCVALLPDMVDEIIAAAGTGRAAINAEAAAAGRGYFSD